MSKECSNSVGVLRYYSCSECGRELLPEYRVVGKCKICIDEYDEDSVGCLLESSQTYFIRSKD